MTTEAYPLSWPAGRPRLVPLTRGLFAYVDERDFASVSAFKWHAHKGKRTWYARTDVTTLDGRQRIYMHKLLLPDTLQVDHRDGNGLNNSRANLRPCTTAQNQANRRKSFDTSSRFKGVSFDKRRGRWIAQISHQKRHINLGRTADEESAAARYDVAAKLLFGEFASSNLGVIWSVT